ncbi:MAG: type III pantothenate kinase [Elusimicrobia bacterium]|nr:type III pantothenate kinase [Elusimicrobiota bacterium]
MLLAIDIGNTNITFGIFRISPSGASPSHSEKLIAGWRLATQKNATADDYGAALLSLFRYAGLDPHHVQGVVVDSVVPSLDGAFQELAEKYFRRSPLFVDGRAKTGMKILYENPKEVGADRIVNAVAAYARVRGACIVVDFGTATTFDCINAQGHYVGGAITPGPLMAAEALAQKTAKLPLLGVFRRPPSVIGRTTLDSIASGLFYGYWGLVEGLLQRLRREMGGQPRVLATGGLASLLAPHVKLIKEVVPDLTLEGLKIIWKRNR